MFEKHSLMIYQLIEKNPILLDKFNFLLNYPELLSFNVRSSYFRTKMKNKIDLKSLIQIKINRKNLLNSSFNVLNKISNEDFLRRICIVYNDEPGVDAGGIVRDWFTNLIKEIFNQNYGLFICSGINNSYTPNRLSYLNSNHLDYYKFVGRLIARALMQPQCVDAHFSASFCKQILHRVPNFDDLKEIDDVLFESLKYMQNNDVDSLEMFFAINREELGVVKTIPLIENGENISVTNKNKNEYIRLRVNYFFNYETKDQAKAFCEGFYFLIPHEKIKLFSPSELDLMICGIPDVDIDDLRRNTEYTFPYNNDHPLINMFFNVISEWSRDDLAKFLLFVTGSSQVPLNGFKEYKDKGKAITISPGGEKERLCVAHTCFNTLDLPLYESEEELNRKLLMSIQELEFGIG